MVADAANVETAAFEVGYESPSQFSREYTPLYNRPIGSRTHPALSGLTRLLILIINTYRYQRRLSQPRVAGGLDLRAESMVGRLYETRIRASKAIILLQLGAIIPVAILCEVRLIF